MKETILNAIQSVKSDSLKEVELGLVQDFISEVKKADDLFSTASSYEDRAKEAYADSYRVISQAEKLYNKIESISKDSGLEMDSTLKRLANKINSMMKDAQSKK